MNHFTLFYIDNDAFFSPHYKHILDGISIFIRNVATYAKCHIEFAVLKLVLMLLAVGLDGHHVIFHLI